MRKYKKDLQRRVLASKNKNLFWSSDENQDQYSKNNNRTLKTGQLQTAI